MHVTAHDKTFELYISEYRIAERVKILGKKIPVDGKHHYVVLIMDVYSRRILGWSAADNMRAENNMVALNRALTVRGIKNFSESLVHHSDRGSQYVSDDYTNLLADYGILISMCTDVLENAHCERVNGTIKNDYLARRDIQNFDRLKREIERAVNNYNNRRHRSLKMTPLEFETYVKELSPEKRTEMRIFTVKQNVENPLQLKLDLGV